MAGRMSNHQRWLRLLSHGLRSHPTCPEYRHLVCANGHRIAVIGVREIMNPDRRRIANVDRCPMSQRIPCRHLDDPRHVSRSHRTHAHNHRSAEAARAIACDARLIHWDIGSQVEVANGKSRPQHGRFKCETTAEQERDEIAAPQHTDVEKLVGQIAVTVHTISGNISAEVTPCRDALWVWISRIGDLKQRTRFGIPLTKDEKIVSQILSQDDEVCLCVSGRERGGRPPPAARADFQPRLTGMKWNQIKVGR